ncbi:MAE_28990/MAE_18760 family HEPN-like nuclease [Lactococcus lactis]|uniref:MAE_28990/MAE_18760 family HEPN-like nuclease n=1 Tax=Lactococcus lactis TaxID=1358 RepID=UPI002863699C|nr:HEPN domain-containing protein [Lactococcus lactis]MDR7696298.1 HEPN domain-containing protein [Lactococcus lactis]
MDDKELISQISKVKTNIEFNQRIFENLSSKEKQEYKKILHKNNLLEIYTFWENIIKDIIFSTFQEYKTSILNSKVLSNYIIDVHNKRYLRDAFHQELVEKNSIKISKDMLCASNNLTFEEIKKILKKIEFNLENLSEFINSDNRIIESMEELKKNDIIPLNSSDTDIVKNNKDTCFAYVNLIVEERNKIAHGSASDEIYNSEKFLLIYDFIYNLVRCFNNYLIYCTTGLPKTNFRNLYIVEVIRSNNSDTNAILCIKNLSGHIISKNTTLYICIDNILKPAYIKEIRTEDKVKTNEDIQPFTSYSIEVYTEIPIRKNSVAKKKLYYKANRIKIINSSDFQLEM